MNPMFLFLLFIIFMAQDKPKTLDDFRWENRIVLYFPQNSSQWTSPDDSLKQMIEERKIKYFVVSDSLISNAEIEFTPDYIKRINSKYKMGTKNSSWVLIGLDGGAKVRKEELLDWGYIFKTIDAMPMRQSEIRRKGRG